MPETVQIRANVNREIAERLDALSARTGRSIDRLLRQLIEDSLDRLEYEYELLDRVEAVRSGRVKTKSLEQIGKELGLEH